MESTAKKETQEGNKTRSDRIGPLGAEPDDENQWEFRSCLELTELEKRRLMAEVMRLAVELTHLCSFKGRCYKQKEGGQ